MSVALVLVVVISALLVLFVPVTSPHGSPQSTQSPKTPVQGVPQAVDPQFAPTVLVSPYPVANGGYGTSVAETPSVVAVGSPGETEDGLLRAGSAYLYFPSTGATRLLFAPNPTTSAQFGYAVAASGNLVVVGAPNGATSGGGEVYLFNDSGGLIATYTSPNALIGGDFGLAVSISGNYIVVGAPYETVDGVLDAGNAYLINIQTGATRPIFSPVPQFDGAFGTSVSISGNLAAVGAPLELSGGVTQAGNAYVFSVVTGNLIEAIPEPLPYFDSWFGYSVSISGVTLVVGAPQASGDNGAAFQFELDTHTMTQLTSPNAALLGEFGISVAVDGVTVLVGAEGEESGGILYAGNAYLFSQLSGALITSTFNAPGWPWEGHFGRSVAEVGSSIVVGASAANASGFAMAGQAYLFTQVPLTLTSPNAVNGGGLGFSSAINEGIWAAGAPDETAGGHPGAGNVYVAPVDPSPSLSVRTLSSPSAQTNGSFGYSLAMGGTDLVVGAPGETAGGDSQAGHAYVFSSLTGVLLWTLTSPNPVVGGEFGFSAAISGNLVVVGAPNETYSLDSSAGRAYVFNASTGALVSTLSTSNPVVGGNFGYSVGITTGAALIGAPGEGGGALSGSGRAYIMAPTTGALLATLNSPNSQSGGGFGTSVSINGGVAVVGASGETVLGSPSAGRAYIFASPSGTLEQTLLSPNAATNGHFGRAVSTNGATVIVGAPGETAVGLIGAGDIYIFASNGTILDRFYSPGAQGDAHFGSSVWEGSVRIVVGEPGILGATGGAGASFTGRSYLFGFGTTPL